MRAPMLRRPNAINARPPDPGAAAAAAVCPPPPPPPPAAAAAAAGVAAERPLEPAACALRCAGDAASAGAAADLAQPVVVHPSGAAAVSSDVSMAEEAL